MGRTGLTQKARFRAICRRLTSYVLPSTAFLAILSVPPEATAQQPEPLAYSLTMLGGDQGTVTLRATSEVTEISSDDPTFQGASSAQSFLAQLRRAAELGLPTKIWRYQYTFSVTSSPITLALSSWPVMSSPLFGILRDLAIDIAPDEILKVQFLTNWPPRMVKSAVNVLILADPPPLLLTRGDGTPQMPLYVPSHNSSMIYVEPSG
jgi:hypothetical protein